MRRLPLLLVAGVLLVTSCGDGGGEVTGSDTTGPPSGQGAPTGPVASVRVAGSLEPTATGWILCPAGVAPCWPVIDDGGLDLDAGWVVAEGQWRDDTIGLSNVEARPDLDDGFPNPCADEDLGRFDDTDPREPELGTVIGSLPTLAGVWRSGAVLVVVLTGDLDTAREAIEAVGAPGVCVADMGFEHTVAELEAAQQDLADRLARWGDAGWVVTSLGIDVVANEVVVTVDEIDHRFRTEVDADWGDMVRIEAAVEVLDATVDLLERELPDSEIPVTTQPRGSGGMGALGTFVLRYDEALDCLWLGTTDDERVKPIWPFGTRALREPVVVLDGWGDPVVAVDQSVELGGGFGQVLPGSEDPTDCGATEVWVIAPG